MTVLSLTVYGITYWNDLKITPSENSESKDIATLTPMNQNMELRIFEDFIYEIGTRFGPIKKSDIDKATSFSDFLETEEIASIVAFKSVDIVIIKDDKETDIREIGYSNTLTASQLTLLQSFKHSTNFMIRADFQQKNKETGRLENNYTSPYLTIVPEKQAEYANGIDSLKEFLKENSITARVQANVDPEKLKPAKLYFTVTKSGTIENVKLDRSSNYPLVDKKMIELIQDTPGKWLPAENIKGEKVDQELVVSFGLMGC